MFGKRGVNQGNTAGFKAPPTAPELEKKDVPAAAPAAPEREKAAVSAAAVERVEKAVAKPAPPKPMIKEKTEEYYDTKSSVFTALIDTIDLGQLSRMEADAAREEIRDIVNDIISIKNLAMSISEQEELLEDICNDVLGYGPLEPLLARDDIADIMINGAKQTFIGSMARLNRPVFASATIPS